MAEGQTSTMADRQATFELVCGLRLLAKRLDAQEDERVRTSAPDLPAFAGAEWLGR